MQLSKILRNFHVTVFISVWDDFIMMMISEKFKSQKLNKKGWEVIIYSYVSWWKTDKK